ncbi:hypothetical protein H6F88_28240 [Oculatella sp. FACHB-28]|uniref:hypothetical protein n=1 Tax=Oculatella sp. FACHB-28 TaxID=2692845 RepID=UPI001681D612|nr:hypothetical protein [Oculatella sp. FACHB-28]MBD2059832.1 hypothetical protein [Oculatella sp. FACHB-28]
MAQYSLNQNSQLMIDDSCTDSAESFQRAYEDVEGYVRWLQESLILGEPIDYKLQTQTNFSKNSYVEAFGFIRKSILSDELSEDVIKELRLYLDYLINYFIYFN